LGQHTTTNTHCEKQVQFLILTGWLVPVGVASSFLDLDHGDRIFHLSEQFDQLYDLHPSQYLDYDIDLHGDRFCMGSGGGVAVGEKANQRRLPLPEPAPGSGSLRT